MRIGEKIKAIREALGYKQAQLAQAVGVSDKTISYWENHLDANPTFENINKIARAMGITPGYIADFGDPAAEWKHPVTAAAKLDMARKLLREVAEKYPYGQAAQALRVLERDEDPEDVQEYLAAARKILLSNHEMGIKMLVTTIESFETLVE